MKKVKRILWFFGILILVLFILIKVFFFPSYLTESKNLGEVLVPNFIEIPTSFVHENASYSGAALIDFDNDGNEEIFVGGGNGQEDVLLSYDGEKFINVIDGTGLSSIETTFGAISLDVNDDGWQDMIISRMNKLYLYLNYEGVFDREEIPINLEENSIIFSVAPGDINKDGFVDLYVSTFITTNFFSSATYNDPSHGKKNILLLNNGDNTFTDITEESGTGIKQNTFSSIFVDLDGDGFQDLVVSLNTDRFRVYRNLGNLKFESADFLTGYGAWMGVSVGDIDNDGDQDLFLSNMGNFAPNFLIIGDLRDDQIFDTDWALLRNDGGMEFSRVDKEKGLDNLEFAWGSALEDINLDGKMDLFVVGNFIDWPPHKIMKTKSRLFLQDSEGNFLPATKLTNLENKHFGQSPIIADINGDGIPDVIYVNVHGPLRVLINKGDVGNYLKVFLEDNVKSLGAKVFVIKDDGIELVRVRISGNGLLTDGSSEMFFGLGDYEGSVDVRVEFLSGEKMLFEDIEVNSVFRIS